MQTLLGRDLASSWVGRVPSALYSCPAPRESDGNSRHQGEAIGPGEATGGPSLVETTPAHVQKRGSPRRSPLPFTAGWLGTLLSANIPGPHCASQAFMVRSQCLPLTLPWGLRHPALLEALCPLSAPGDQGPMETPVLPSLARSSFSVSSWVVGIQSSLSSTSSLLGTHCCSWWGWGMREATANTRQQQCPRDHTRGAESATSGCRSMSPRLLLAL